MYRPRVYGKWDLGSKVQNRLHSVNSFFHIKINNEKAIVLWIWYEASFWQEQIKSPWLMRSETLSPLVHSITKAVTANFSTIPWQEQLFLLMRWWCLLVLDQHTPYPSLRKSWPTSLMYCTKKNGCDHYNIKRNNKIHGNNYMCMYSTSGHKNVHNAWDFFSK